MRSQEDDLSSSDSERSCSMLQTAVHSATPTNRRWADPHPSDAAVVVEQWVESTTKVPSFRLQGEQIPYKKILFFFFLIRPILKLVQMHDKCLFKT